MNRLPLARFWLEIDSNFNRPFIRRVGGLRHGSADPIEDTFDGSAGTNGVTMMARFDMTGAAETGPSNTIEETLFQLGIASSTGRDGQPDLIAAHKWFNLAAMRGNGEAARYRAEIAMELTSAEIAEAQRAAREWIRRQ